MHYLKSGHIHPSAEAIYKHLKPAHPSLSLATVYNTLEVLVEAGEIVRLTIDAQRTNYEYGRTPHDHFWCRSCGRIYDIPAARARQPKFLRGHRVEHSVQYHHGVCRECLPKTK
ncbi:ferric uptake regulation proteins [Candidatus Termititenax spirochaetophilus]|uniref:Ferric uptake regulation proteins n=1 Tax=Candidatus Termititenax spirochaetophilus TaxID=2218522 RepID=A0A388T819_9BACT|nr:ferric uptake regulation proteins [Candidatus Termititenax spirochaetophilus]